MTSAPRPEPSRIIKLPTRPVLITIGLLALGWAFRWGYLPADSNERLRINRWTGTTESYYDGNWRSKGESERASVDISPGVWLLLAGGAALVLYVFRRKSSPPTA